MRIQLFIVVVGFLCWSIARANQESELFQWAWSPNEVASAGEYFWPQFRGPAGDGVSIASGIPTEWSERKNVVWKTPISGKAWSSPVIWGNEIWLSNATEDGKVMSVLTIDRRTGAVLRNLEVIHNKELQPDFHEANSYASPTPVLDGSQAYFHFGAYGTFAMDRKTGEVLWERRDLPCNHFRGPGSSPILFRDFLIFHMDGFDVQYAIALNKKTGETVWKSPRQIEYGTDNGDFYKAFSTPTLIRFGDELQMISPTSKATLALNPNTGEEIWRVTYDEFSATARPLFDGQRVYLNTGFSRAHLMAVRPNGRGIITRSHVDWEVDRGIGSKPSQLLHRDWIFNVSDSGVACCLRKSDGELVWQHRLGGDFSASPILIEDKLYLFDHEGKGYVIAADETGTILATNHLDSGCMASPAAVAGSLIVRTKQALYCIE